MFITERIDLNLGYACNARCVFCYYRRHLKCGNSLSLSEAKKWLKFFRTQGKEAVDFTGGEPTIHKDIVTLITYARELGYKSISIITNGISIANKDFLGELVRAGLNDILFSLHGYSAAVHDGLTGVGGSFDKILAAVKNAAEYDLRLRSNTVVCAANFKDVDGIAGLLAGFNVKNMNFILFNPAVDMQVPGAGIGVKYGEAAPYLKDILDKHGNGKQKITLRYIPFCLMPGYERFIVNFPQVQYDPFEWDYYLRTYFRGGFFLRLGALAVGFCSYPSWRRLYSIGREKALRELVIWALIRKDHLKGKACKMCAYRQICDGLWCGYAASNGQEELRPVSGKTINDPLFFLYG